MWPGVWAMKIPGTWWKSSSKGEWKGAEPHHGFLCNSERASNIHGWLGGSLCCMKWGKQNAEKCIWRGSNTKMLITILSKTSLRSIHGDFVPDYEHGRNVLLLSTWDGRGEYGGKTEKINTKRGRQQKATCVIWPTMCKMRVMHGKVYETTQCKHPHGNTEGWGFTCFSLCSLYFSAILIFLQ